MNKKWTTHLFHELLLILTLLINAVASSSGETHNHSVELVQRLPEDLQWKADPTVRTLIIFFSKFLSRI
jgi:hypothetical protein